MKNTNHIESAYISAVNAIVQVDNLYDLELLRHHVYDMQYEVNGQHRYTNMELEQIERWYKTKREMLLLHVKHNTMPVDYNASSAAIMKMLGW